MLQLVCLIIGIVGLVKGKVSVSKAKELRGGPLYLVCGLFIAPLPLSFLAGLVLGATAGGSSQADLERSATIIGLVVGLLPVIVGIVLSFVLAQPKVDAGRGFAVVPPKQ